MAERHRNHGDGRNLKAGVPFATPVFDGAKEEESQDGDASGPRRHADRRNQMTLFDGRTGEQFERQVTVGYMHMLKLHHLVDDKDARPFDRPVLARHPAAARRQGAVRRSAFR